MWFPVSLEVPVSLYLPMDCPLMFTSYMLSCHLAPTPLSLLISGYLPPVTFQPLEESGPFKSFQRQRDNSSSCVTAFRLSVQVQTSWLSARYRGLGIVEMESGERRRQQPCPRALMVPFFRWDGLVQHHLK